MAHVPKKFILTYENKIQLKRSKINW